MATINLRDHYPWYRQDCFVEVPDEVAAIINGFELREKSYLRNLHRNKANYSLDRGDGIENDALRKAADPYDEYEYKLLTQQLYSAIAALPDKQAKRVYAHFILGLSKAEIARAEGVNKSQISRSIGKAIGKIKKILETFIYGSNF